MERAFEGIRSERQLMRLAADRLSILWYTCDEQMRPSGIGLLEAGRAAKKTARPPNSSKRCGSRSPLCG